MFKRVGLSLDAIVAVWRVFLWRGEESRRR